MKNGLMALLCLTLAGFLIYVSFFDNDYFKTFDITEIFSDDTDEEYYDRTQNNEPYVNRTTTVTTIAPTQEELEQEFKNRGMVKGKDGQWYDPESVHNYRPEGVQGGVTWDEISPEYDKRVPHYVASSDPDYRELKYSWTSHDGNNTLYVTLYIDKNAYDYYHSLLRYYDVTNYSKYIEDDYNQKVIKQAADCLRDLSRQLGYNDNQTVLEAISFVQLIPYVYDIDTDGKEYEYPKYPIETLFDNGGDCEDTSILLAGILKELGFGVCFIHYDDHVAIGIKGSDGLPGSYFSYNGVNYYYIETTGQNWTIGKIPDSHAGQSAQIVEL